MSFGKKSELQKVLDEQVSERAIFIQNIKKSEKEISELKRYVRIIVKEIESGRQPGYTEGKIDNVYRDLFSIYRLLGAGSLDVLSKMNNLKDELAKANVFGLEKDKLEAAHKHWKYSVDGDVRKLIGDLQTKLG